ncbi:hypothetical protein COO72_09100 [Bifidobacterium callitrichos]|nr:hypothetical protein COO72_09100 [Bifidobacterium callitrichos]
MSGTGATSHSTCSANMARHAGIGANGMAHVSANSMTMSAQDTALAGGSMISWMTIAARQATAVRYTLLRRRISFALSPNAADGPRVG